MSKANVQTARSKLGVVYASGCTGFVAEVLGKAQKHSSQWSNKGQVQYSELSAGDVIGWGGNGVAGHVAIYCGPNQIMNCPGPGKAVKKISTFGNDQQIYRMAY